MKRNQSQNHPETTNSVETGGAAGPRRAPAYLLVPLLALPISAIGWFLGAWVASEWNEPQASAVGFWFAAQVWSWGIAALAAVAVGIAAVKPGSRAMRMRRRGTAAVAVAIVLAIAASTVADDRANSAPGYEAERATMRTAVERCATRWNEASNTAELIADVRSQYGEAVWVDDVEGDIRGTSEGFEVAPVCEIRLGVPEYDGITYRSEGSDDPFRILGQAEPDGYATYEALAPKVGADGSLPVEDIVHPGRAERRRENECAARWNRDAMRPELGEALRAAGDRPMVGVYIVNDEDRAECAVALGVEGKRRDQEWRWLAPLEDEGPFAFEGHNTEDRLDVGDGETISGIAVPNKDDWRAEADGSVSRIKRK